MFVRRKHHVAVCAELLALRLRHAALLHQWNGLVEFINSRGGERFLTGTAHAAPIFTEDELTALVTLCHPDKHGGSKQSETMTIKLLAIRKKMLARKET